MEQKPTPEPDAALDSERARKTWIPQFELDGAAWADFVLGETEFADRFDRYRTGADMLLGEILRYGALGAESDAAMLTEVYARVATDNVVLRHDIYGHVAAFVEDGVIGAVAFLPFVRCDPDRSISAMAVIDYVSMGTLIDGDPMSRVKDITAMIAHGDPKNRGAAFGALLYLGDQRVCDLLLPLRDGLTDAEVREVVGCSTGFLSASSIEFLLDWLEQVEGDERYGRFGIVAGGLGYARRTMQVPVVGTGERPFPAKDIAIEELRHTRREISIEEYTKRIARACARLNGRRPNPR